MSTPDWSQVRTALNSVALVGTGRRPVVWPDALVAHAGTDATPESQLLALAALTRAARLAGTKLAAVTPLKPAPPDELRDPPKAAVQLLELLLYQNPVGDSLRNTLLEEWLTAALDRGCRVPHHLIMAPLRSAGVEPRVRALLLSAIDSRGRWLTAQLAGAAPKGAAQPGAAPKGAAQPGATQPGQLPTVREWELVPDRDRAELLAAIRTTDPDHGRELLAATWNSEPARVKVKLIEALEHGLSMADEPLLESALDERASTVREAAAKLLGWLPQSRYSARMRERLADILHQKPGTPEAAGPLTARFPETDNAAVRDALPGPNGSPYQRSLAVTEVARATPLDFWQAYGAPADVLPRLASDLRTGVTLAAMRHEDVEWARAHLAHRPASFHRFALVLEPDERRAIIEPLLFALNKAYTQIPALCESLGEAWPDGEPWPDDLAADIVALVIRNKQLGVMVPKIARNASSSVVRDLASLAGPYATPATLEHLSEIRTFDSLRTSIREAFHEH